MPDDKENQSGEDQNSDQSQGGEGQGGTGTKNWYDGLDGDLKSNPSITKFKSEADLAKSYIELQKALGKDKVQVPTEKSTPEEWRAFFRKVGTPEKEDEYDVGDEDLPEQVRPDAATKEQFRKAMHGENMTKKQFEAAWKFYKTTTLNKLNQEVTRIQALKGSAETELRNEWGGAYDGKVTQAQGVINTFFKDKGISPEFKVLANDKGFIKAMAEIAEKLGEDVIAGKPRTTKTPDEASKEYNEIMRSGKKHPFFNELDPEHDQMVEYVAGLQELMMAGRGQ